MSLLSASDVSDLECIATTITDKAFLITERFKRFVVSVSTSGAELAAQFAGERASASIFARGLAKDAPYNPTETEAIDTFKGIYDLIFNDKYLENPPLAPLLAA